MGKRQDGPPGRVRQDLDHRAASRSRSPTARPTDSGLSQNFLGADFLGRCQRSWRRRSTTAAKVTRWSSRSLTGSRGRRGTDPELVDQLEAKGVALRVLNFGGGPVDTRGATGRLILNMFAAMAQFEREMMLERQREGIAKAKAQGKYKGRKTDRSG